MKKLIIRIGLSGVFILAISGVVWAETMYVTDVLRLTLRTGQSTEHKIIAVIESGQEVEILESGEEWSSVRLTDGKEGWVLTRYLTPRETYNVKLKRLEDKHKNLRAQAASLLEENTKLNSENKKLKAASGQNEKALNRIQSDFESLKSESAEFIKLKTKYQKSTKRQRRRASLL
jgi:SH3 domain protein